MTYMDVINTWSLLKSVDQLINKVNNNNSPCKRAVLLEQFSMSAKFLFTTLED